MKTVSYLLVILLLLQSCNVYNEPTSAREAVIAEKKVKVITTDRQKYKFRRLENEGDRLIGITKQGSKTAKKLAAMPAEVEGKYLAIDLTGVDIEKIRVRNQTGSVVLTIVAIAGALYLAINTAAILLLSSWGM